MGEENSLLKLWELSEADLEAENVVTLMKSFSVSKQEDIIEDFQSLKFCDNCFASNCEDANWCIECGTAIISSSVSEHHCSDVANICQVILMLFLHNNCVAIFTCSNLNL